MFDLRYYQHDMKAAIRAVWERHVANETMYKTAFYDADQQWCSEGRS